MQVRTTPRALSTKHPCVVALPKFRSWGDKVRRAMRLENTPGAFPTPRASSLQARGEEPARMFAGEGDRSAPTGASTTSQACRLAPQHRVRQCYALR